MHRSIAKVEILSSVQQAGQAEAAPVATERSQERIDLRIGPALATIVTDAREGPRGASAESRGERPGGAETRGGGGRGSTPARGAPQRAARPRVVWRSSRADRAATMR